jgi:hypothetical protein
MGASQSTAPCGRTQLDLLGGIGRTVKRLYSDQGRGSGSRKQCLKCPNRLLQQLVYLRRVLAPRFRKIGAATLDPNDGGRALSVPGIHPVREIRGDASHNLSLVIE